MVNAQDVEDFRVKAANAISRLGRVIPPELRLGFFSYVKHLRMTNVRVRYKTKIVNLSEETNCGFCMSGAEELCVVETR